MVWPIGMGEASLGCDSLAVALVFLGCSTGADAVKLIPPDTLSVNVPITGLGCCYS